MSKQQRKRAVRAPAPPSGDQIRRIGRAVIALAQAQLEADAQAAGEGRQTKPPHPSKTGTRRRAQRPTGDAA